MPTDTVAKILELLEREGVALKTGSFDTLDSVAELKDNLFDDLTRGQPSSSDLWRIKSRLTENQTLFSAAIRGVSAARDRIEALQNVREGLSVYDQSGQMEKVSTQRPVLRKKA